ncbi:2'-5' RNA ligase family protein [Streptococcus equinus]|uniref:2'-5' RNA ligase family protein n=1 Tax=Streptococcus equinus TaxID=1335 RepID=UPI00215A4BB1|nr:2'-5' RNA ligase family protein [Streptococcus equinus]UVF02722.1 2'-5' RNA ligase family protein [Streptococcus equinus]
MFALIMTLDDNLQATIKEFWKELSDAQLSQYAYEVTDREPHITLASFDEGTTKDDIIKGLETLTLPDKPIDISFTSIGSFINANIIFFSPIKTPQMSKLHFDIHQQLSDYLSKDSLYSPNNWVPHLTIANRIAEDKMAKAYHYCLKHLSLSEGKVIGIKLISITPDNQVQDIFQKTFS